MRIKAAFLAFGMASTGCAVQPVVPQPEGPANAAVPECVRPAEGVARADYCRYPPDVRAFLDDRDLCDHFRSEPWPEGDTEGDRLRRRQLVEGVRTSCAGTDRQLEDLLKRYRDDAGISQLLSQFERGIEGDGTP